MSHQPFETWIFEKAELTQEQQQDLQDHLKICATCTDLHQAFQAVEFQLKNAPMASPLPGFTQRFSANLAKRQEKEKIFQIRRFFLFLALANGLAVTAFAIYVLSTSSLADFVGSLLSSAAKTLLIWVEFKQIFIEIFFTLPPIIPVTLWVLLTSSFAVLVMTWIAALWRISTKGVKVK